MEPPVLNIPGELTFVLQAGIVKESVTLNISDISLEKLKEIACNFLDKRVSIFCMSAFQIYVLVNI